MYICFIKYRNKTSLFTLIKQLVANRYLVVFILFFLSFSAYSQFDDITDCGFDQLTLRHVNNDPEKKKSFDKLNKLINNTYTSLRQTRSLGNNISLPIVVHLIVPPGTPIGIGNNLTDEQVRDGIDLLNQSFRNEGSFFNPDGVDTEIQFCLASRTADGQPSSGITRTESDLVASNNCASGLGTDAADGNAIKGLINWPCNEYINVWLVTDLFNDNFGCGLAGFATLPTNNCGVGDGVMQESRYWNTIGGTGVTAHELGHFLGLLHTFSGGCTNDNCLQDGDLVCDTPPDNSQEGPCDSNSCNTDIPDLIDDSFNYMDYTGCTPMKFTEGQKARMLGVLETARSSLCLSNACNPVLRNDLAVALINQSGVQCDNIICPQVTVRNVGLDTIFEFEILFDLSNAPSNSFNWSGELLPNERLKLTLNCIEVIGTSYNISGSVSTVNGIQDENGNNDNFVDTGNIFTSPQLTLNNLEQAVCLSNGAVILDVINGTPPYLFTLDGFSTSRSVGIFTLLSAGDYSCIVRDDNGCLDSLDFTITNDCVFTDPDEFVLNLDAFATGNQCYTLTRDLQGEAGSIWYQSNINLNNSFKAAFTINFGTKNADGADGLAFVLQPISTAIGVSGGGIGYQGVSPSFVCEFDTWQNNNNSDPGYDHISLMKNGDVNHSSANNLFGPIPIKGTNANPQNVEDGSFYELSFEWDEMLNTFKVYVDCELKLEYKIDLKQEIFNGDSEVFFGFTSSTGGFSNVQQVCLKHLSFLDSLSNLSICLGDSTSIIVNPVFDSYQWTPLEDISNANTNQPVFSPDSSRWYFVTMDDGCGFVIEDSLFVEVLDYEFEAIPLDDNICDDTSLSQIIVTTNIDSNTILYSIDGTNYSQDTFFTGLADGSYTIFSDLNGCLKTKNVNIESRKNLLDSLVYLQHPNCQNPLGIITLTGIDGTPPYTYRINGGIQQATGHFDGLLSGNYTITIEDQQGCMKEVSFTLTEQIYTLSLQIDDQNLELSCVDTTAFISVTAIGGSGPYLYRLDDSPIVFEGIFVDLPTGPHKIYSIDEFGCSSDTLSFMVTEDTTLFNTPLFASICSGDSFLLASSYYKESGVFLDTLIASNGCDSILELKLTVNEVYEQNISVMLCEGENFTVGNSNYSSTGLYRDTLKTIDNCDSIILLDLTVYNTFLEQQELSICQNDSIKVGTNNYSIAGLYLDTLYTSMGCDSIIETSLTVFENSIDSFFVERCEGETFTIGQQVYNSSGIYIDSFTNSRGCDSILYVDLTVFPTIEQEEMYEICQGESVIIRGEEFDTEGSYIQTISDNNNCDRIIEIEIQIVNTSACDQKICNAYIPNVFSPNDDGTNDVFTAYSPSISFNSLSIFDRWGNLVFQSSEEDPSWDGNLRGREALEGVYVYQLSGICITNSVVNYFGDLTLLR